MSESHVERVPEWTLGDRLRKALDSADVAVEEMADYLGYSTATMRNWTHDRAVPRPTVLRQWALRCGVPYEWLANGGPGGPSDVITAEQLASALAYALETAEEIGLEPRSVAETLSVVQALLVMGTTRAAVDNEPTVTYASARVDFSGEAGQAA